MPDKAAQRIGGDILDDHAAPMTDRMTVLAADIGGSSVKAALVSSVGAVVAQAALPAPTPDADGMIAPADWWTAFRDAATTLRRDDASAFAAVAAITVTGVTRTPVILDADANPLIDAMPARDARAGTIAAHARIDPQDCAEEAADLLYHLAVLMEDRGFAWEDVVAVLKSRHASANLTRA